MTVSSPGVPPPPPTSPIAKKGLSPLAWVGIGCGVLLVLIAIGLSALGWFAKKKIAEYGDNPEMVAAELIVAANPDVEKVSSDSEAKTITVRDKKTGEVTTLNLADIKEGKFEVKNDKGEVVSIGSGTDTGDLPSWLPIYPGGQTQSGLNANSPDGKGGTFAVSTSDSVDQVIAFYEAKLKEAGLNVNTTTTTTTSDGKTSIVTGTSADEKRSVTVLVGASEGGSQASVTYSEKP